MMYALRITPFLRPIAARAILGVESSLAKSIARKFRGICAGHVLLRQPQTLQYSSNATALMSMCIHTVAHEPPARAGRASCPPAGSHWTRRCSKYLLPVRQEGSSCQEVRIAQKRGCMAEAITLTLAILAVANGLDWTRPNVDGGRRLSPSDATSWGCTTRR